MANQQFDVSSYRSQFPALQMLIGGRPQIFFDNPGGTQVPRRVAEAMSDYLLTSNANVHGAFETSRRTDHLLDEAHAAMADLLNASGPEEIYFGQNMTSLTFALSRALGREMGPGDEIVVTRLDHDGNIAPWLALAERGVAVRWADIDPEECTLDYDHLTGLIGPRTRLVAMGLASNAVGTINDVARVAQIAHHHGALLFVDAVQGVPHLPVDVQALGCDLLACSAYKFFGPHQGIIWGKRDLLERLTAYKVRPAANELPGKWETGTQSHEGQAGTLAAVSYLQGIGKDHVDRYAAALGSLGGRRRELRAAMLAIRDYEQRLSAHMLQRLRDLKDYHLYGISDPGRLADRVPTFALVHNRLTPQQLAGLLGEQGMATWAGNYYALALVERIGRAEHGMLRIGLAHYNTITEIDNCCDLLAQLPGTV